MKAKHFQISAHQHTLFLLQDYCGGGGGVLQAKDLKSRANGGPLHQLYRHREELRHPLVVPFIISTTAMAGQFSCEFLWGHLGKRDAFLAPQMAASGCQAQENIKHGAYPVLGGPQSCLSKTAFSCLFVPGVGGLLGSQSTASC